MFGMNRKKALKKQEARVELHKALDETLEKLGAQYTDAINEPDAAKRFMALDELNKAFVNENNQQNMVLKDIKEKVNDKEILISLGSGVTIGVLGVVALYAGVGTGAVPIEAGLALASGSVVSIFGSAAYYMMGDKRQEKKVAKILNPHKEDIADFLKATNELQQKVTQKIKFEKENNYQDILTAPAYAEFEEKFPELDKEFAKKSVRVMAEEKKLSEKPTYTMPKNGVTPPKPKGI